ncbi:hypothetical protein ACFQH1_09280 [Lactiplantibacillus daoliensis]|uniref:Transposase n=1 Tax=Lactiplantibacillus daoliensis TaxID=2559916 RepID=A0ABW1UHQ8_9LACO
MAELPRFMLKGYPNRQIAQVFGVCHQTTANELTRGTVDQVKRVNDKLKYYRQYVPEAAQTRYKLNRLPRRELNYRTTEEVFTAECLRVRRRTAKVATAD